MASKTLTGGEKEFVYTKEDTKRIQAEDTESTKEFKKALDSWYEGNKTEKLMAEAKRKAILTLLSWTGAAILLVALFFLAVRLFPQHP